MSVTNLYYVLSLASCPPGFWKWPRFLVFKLRFSGPKCLTIRRLSQHSYNFSQDASLLTYYNQDTNLATVERLLETVWSCPPLDTITAQKLNAVRGQAHEAGMGTQEVRCKRVHFNEAERWVELTTPFRAPAREKAALHGRMSTTLSFPSLFCLAVNLFCN